MLVAGNGQTWVSAIYNYNIVFSIIELKPKNRCQKQSNSELKILSFNSYIQHMHLIGVLHTKLFTANFMIFKGPFCDPNILFL